MAGLADEFRSILIQNTAKSPFCFHCCSVILSEPTSHAVRIEVEDYVRRVNSEVINDLRSVAWRMEYAGFLQECTQVYTIVRKSIVNSCVAELSVPVVNSVRLEWKDFESEIKVWRRAATSCVKVVFTYEKQLSTLIFDGMGEGVADSCFLEIVKDPVMQLFKFVEEVSSISTLYGNLFIVLEMYKVCLDLFPKLNGLFGSNSLEVVRIRIRGEELLGTLDHEVRSNLGEYEKSVLERQFMIPTGEEINFLHVYVNKVMLTVERLCSYKNVFSYHDQLETHPLSLYLIRIIENLVANVEEKSKLYKDASMTFTFLRNHIRYIAREISSNTLLSELIGHDYQNKLVSKLHEVKADHLNMISERMVYCLRDEGIRGCWTCFNMVSKSELRGRITTFDGLFAEVLNTLQNPVEGEERNYYDQHLKSILEKLSPAYTSFLDKFRSYIDVQIKYNSAEELEDAILRFMNFAFFTM